jgi:hypothetical protein
MTTGEYTAYDVKSKNYRKVDSYVAPDGYKRNLKGSFISRGRTKEQKKLRSENNIRMKLSKTLH